MGTTTLTRDPQVLRVAGTSVPRADAVEKVTGQAKFTADIFFEDRSVLHVALACSDIPHGEILGIDTGAAEQYPGVVAVLTREDLRDLDPYLGDWGRSHPILALDRVRYVGEPVAAVAAVDPLVAREAARQITAKYRDLPCSDRLEDAAGPDSAEIHAGAPSLVNERDVAERSRYRNVCSFHRRAWGNVDAALERADLCFQDTFRFPPVFHYAMEPHTAVAQVVGTEITIWTSTQGANLVRQEIARVFRCPLHQIRVIVPYVGGGFGGKNAKLELLLVALARKTGGRPVKLVCSVAESMNVAHRHAALVRLHTGVNRDGIIVARKAEILLDTGAYAVYGPRAAFLASYRMLGPYRVEHGQIDVFAIYTNTAPASAFRAPTSPQVTWAWESHLDMVADALSLDPWEFRRRNLAPRGAELGEGLPPLDCDVSELARGLADFRLRAAVAQNRGRHAGGVGFAVTAKTGGAGPAAMCIARLRANGEVSVAVASSEIGQGSNTVLGQIAAEELGVQYQQVRVVPSDTGIAPYDTVTASSRTTVHTGRAVQLAARDLVEQVRRIAAHRWGYRPQDVRLENGFALGPDGRLAFGALAAWECGGEDGELVGIGTTISQAPARGELLTGVGPFWEVNLGMAAVSVDTETGQVRLKAYASATDAGRAINPQLLEGQDQGGVVQGIGHTFFEEMRYEEGQLVNGNLIDYHVPTFEDVPDEFETVLVENGDGPGPFGAKGVSEGGIMSVSGAVANAFARATGARLREMPLTPERGWLAMQGKSRAGRQGGT